MTNYTKIPVAITKFILKHVILYQLRREGKIKLLIRYQLTPDSLSVKTCGRPDIPANTSIVPDKGSYNCGDFIQVNSART